MRCAPRGDTGRPGRRASKTAGRAGAPRKFDFSGFSFHTPTIKGVALVAGACAHPGEIRKTKTETVTAKAIGSRRSFIAAPLKIELYFA